MISKIKAITKRLDSPFITPDYLDLKYIPSLDGWRAVAIIMVVQAHFMLTLEKGTVIHTILKFTTIGILGVKIFFVLSGFLITTLLIKEKIKFGQINLKKFFIRRGLRIVPVLYIYLISVFFINEIFQLNLIPSNFLGPLLYINNFNFFSAIWLTGHTWSLAVEEQFYLIWPFVFRYLSNSLKICLIIIIIIPFIKILQHLNPQISNYILAPFFVPASSIFTGVLISLSCFNSYISNKFIKQKKFKYSIFIVCIIWIYVNYYISSRGIYGIYSVPFGDIFTDFCIAYLILFSIVRKSHFIFAILNSKFLKKIGVISYSIYIWQQLFIIPKGNYPILEQYFYFPFNLILVFGFGYLSYYFFERPFLKLKNKFANH